MVFTLKNLRRADLFNRIVLQRRINKKQTGSVAFFNKSY